jgi:hypothetical protein
MTAIDAQRTAIALLAEMADTWPDLPAPTVTVHQEPEFGVTLRLERGCDLEAWREVLDISPELLVWHVYTNAVWVECASYFSRVRVVLHADVPVAPDVAGVLPVVDAERRRLARLDVQRHEVEDPVVPPLLVRTLADAPDAAADFRRSVDAGFVTLPQWGPTPAPASVDVETGGAL